MNIKIKKLNDDAKIPVKGTEFSAGYDLFSCEKTTILGCTSPGMNRGIVKTGVSISIPHGYYGRIAPRSGLAFKKGIDVLAGVIDSDYRGEIGVVLLNTDNNLFKIQKGDKIAQIIIEKCHDVDWEEEDSLSQTERGEGGFGSTGEK